MIDTPFFVDMRLAPGPQRDQALEVLEQALDGTGRQIDILAEIDVLDMPLGVAADTLADLIVTDSAELAHSTALPMLIVLEDGLHWSAGLAQLEEVCADRVVTAMREAFVPKKDPSAEIEALWSDIQSETLPQVLLRQWYPLLLMGTVGRLIRRYELLPNSRSFAGLGRLPDPSDDQIALLMGKADALADIYGQKYRSSFVGRFFLSAVVAVSVALMLFVVPEQRNVVYAVEFVTSLLIILSFRASMKGDWKGKWLSNRYIAESLRNALAMGHDGGGFLLQNRDYPDDPVSAEDRLIDWCTRHIIRHDRSRTAAEREAAFAALIDDQIGYHETRLDQLTRIERRLSRVGMVSFLISMTIAAGALAAGMIAPDALDKWLAPIALSLGILPAVGAALFAIRVQSNFNAEALHSNAVIGRLTAIRDRLTDAPDMVIAMLRARFVAMQRSEFADWSKVQQGRALDLP